ncbi:LAMI_0H18382g1_1 [Lachancea mirantina]|uniref:LAMI_0H18382g1_1 n=1 Tax=Lachancea mirantina TaxID=1230905 RepID=A0A1G4KJU3_9SACH|nr:LAMI_0H18382g1_1 [Lachancea mirantina]
MYRGRGLEFRNDQYKGNSRGKHRSGTNAGRPPPGGSKFQWKVLLFFLAFWVCLVNYYEKLVVDRVIKRCSWDTWEQWEVGQRPHRVMLLADPQIMDAHSYPGRPKLVNYFTKKILDHYHARNWNHLQASLDPDSTFFLGDLFDGGRRWSDDDWMNEYQRFNNIFRKRSNKLTVMSLPGNHDIGFGDTVVERSLNRFSQYFGECNSMWDIGNHTIVLLDTISLSDTANSNISDVPRQFLDRIATMEPSNPRIMLTHVPLHRDPLLQQCGDLRESQKPFPLQRGIQYQTVIDKDLTEEVLSKIQPTLVFSGDDHDFCHISHGYEIGGIKMEADEITVKSCAMNMGISRPAIQLLSLNNPVHKTIGKTYETEICFLPDPYKPIKVYIFAFILTSGIMAWIQLFPFSFCRTFDLFLGQISVGGYPLLPVVTRPKQNSSANELKSQKIQGLLISQAVMVLLITLIFMLS